MSDTTDNIAKGYAAALNPVNAAIGLVGGRGFGRAGNYWGRAGNAAGYNQTSYKNYRNMNDLVKQWNTDNPNQYSQGATNMWMDVYGGGRSLSGRKKDPVYYAGYGIKNDTGNQVVDQYANYLLGGGNQGANDWLSGQRKSYSDAMGSAADQAVRDYLSGYKSNQGTAVNNAQSSAYDEAKSKLDAQKAYGYLSDVGYQKALDKLNTQTGNVRAAMNDAYSAQLQNWEDNLNQMYAKATGGIGAWDFANPFTENALYKDAVNNAANYAGTSMSDDVLNSLLGNVDLYTPDEWIAYGAGNQGQYNPLSDFSTTGRRKKNVTSTEGINEV